MPAQKQEFGGLVLAACSVLILVMLILFKAIEGQGALLAHFYPSSGGYCLFPCSWFLLDTSPPLPLPSLTPFPDFFEMIMAGKMEYIDIPLLSHFITMSLPNPRWQYFQIFSISSRRSANFHFVLRNMTQGHPFPLQVSFWVMLCELFLWLDSFHFPPNHMEYIMV